MKNWFTILIDHVPSGTRKKKERKEKKLDSGLVERHRLVSRVSRGDRCGTAISDINPIL